MIKVLFGIRPTDKNLHLGHAALIKKSLDYLEKALSKDDIIYNILLADAHALTTGTDEKKKYIYENLSEFNLNLRSQILNLIKNVLIKNYNYLEHSENSLRKDEKTFIIHFYNQLSNSKIELQNEKLFELFIKIINVMSYSEITSIPTIKEYKNNKTKEEYISAGFINYPLLQIADILSFEPDIVFIGKDQVPNIKIIDKVINKLKYVYNEDYKKPEFVVYEDIIYGYDGRKMSKSYGNVISFSEDDNIIKDKIMMYLTDGHKKGEKGNPNNCQFYKFITNFLSENEIESIANYCSKGEALCKKCKEKYGSNIIYLKNILM